MWWDGSRAGVPNLWYAYHRWYAERLQVVRRKFLFHQKSKVDINWKEKNKKNKHAGMFEEVIDTSKLKITVSKHMFLRKQQLKTTK